MLDQKQSIPFLSPDRDRLLEYDISRAISRVSDSSAKVVGIMSPLPVAGSPMGETMGGGQNQEPWVLYSELKRDFTVEDVPMSVDKIPDNVNVLVVIHPRGITDAAQYAIDQFVLRGGKLIAFLDPNAILDRQQGDNFMPQASSSNLDKLLKAWGVSFKTKYVIADMTYLGSNSRGPAPGALALPNEAMSKEDIVTADAGPLFMVFAGAFAGTPGPGLTETVLIKSSTNAQLVDPMAAAMSSADVANNFAADNTEYPIAIRLTGTFPTAFPDGAPKEVAGAAPGLTQSGGENTVILVGDSDFIQDQLAVIEQQNPFGGGRMLMPANGNLAFAQGAIEQMAGDNNLIAVRSRATRERPFTVVQKMEESAEATYRDKIKGLEASLADTERNLSELQQRRDPQGNAGDQSFILSAEQQTQLDNFRKTESSVKKELKDVRRNLRAATDSLEERIKWINIAGMPALVTVAGIALAFIKRRRVAAQ